MSAARWDRLAATLAEHGHTVTVSRHAYTEAVHGRVRSGVSRSITLPLGGGHTVEVHDTWWQRNADVWTGWRVDVLDAEGIIRQTFRLTKKRAEVADAVSQAVSRFPRQ